MKGFSRACALLMIVLVAAAVPASAAPPSAGARYQAKTPRGAAAGVIVSRWAGHVQATYGTAPMRWAESMRPTLARAPLASLQAAAKASGFDAAMAALSGGQPQARAGAKAVPGKADVAITRGLLYTMITPCRILDTRVIANPLQAGQARSFGVNASFASGQGGSYCDVPAGASAVTLNVTVVGPEAAGYLTVYPHNASRPLASSLNYRAGDIVGNEIIARQYVDGEWAFSTPSFTIYSYAQTHVVVDISGYFAAPQSEPLDCVEVNSASTAVAVNATARAVAPACPAGYTATGGGCVSAVYPSVNGLFFSNFGPSGSSAFVCDGNNRGTSTVTFAARGTCCRIPGQ